MRVVSLRILLTVCGALLATTAGSAYAAPPDPVMDSTTAGAAVARTKDGYAAVSAGRRINLATSPTPSGTWTVQGTVLPDGPPDWITSLGSWAPELQRVGDSWVLYFSVLATGMSSNQRCIGAATASEPTGPFTYVTRPLVCPENGAGDPVPGRPLKDAGAIDPSVYQARDGGLYLLYKTQKLPATLRIVRLNSTGTQVREGATSRELVQSKAIIEHPLLVKRGNRFVLFASYRTYNTCKYRTIFMKARSIKPGAFQKAPRHELLTSRNTGVCGPGGADIAPTNRGPRIFFNGWVCKQTKPCPEGFNSHQAPERGRRVMYVRRLTWRGSTPLRGSWVRPSP